MGNFELGIIILVFLTAAIIACAVVLYPGIRDLVNELREED